ncbi:hypothetical protein JH06_2293 [Blastocystis sp. subtype 4]|uniref:hypothetical protein n=1 Tax=Blastocystis sp. subtype 4 TaxID=944170 RepID=UPI0007118884|nr:hypothetical protein JH06_2293 [Blastocystis sp. subtype 4]KNB43778.1 hypothetical protein JH06_2293 [Blastocystis sp. subtype 4]|eukprot:XP_014527221.1 hypothetical protein JH06_2293 [Blastocystis sp. subtype 4]
MNDYLYNIGFGLFHTGVEINGVEYSFGEEMGIGKGEPKQAGGARFRESINMGMTYFSNAEIDRKIDNLRDIYRGDQYHVVLKNCNHFSNDLCIALLDTPIPSYINRCATIASWFSCLFPRPEVEKEQIKHFSGHGNRLDNRKHSADTNTV